MPHLTAAPDPCIAISSPLSLLSRLGLLPSTLTSSLLPLPPPPFALLQDGEWWSSTSPWLPKESCPHCLNWQKDGSFCGATQDTGRVYDTGVFPVGAHQQHRH